MKKIKKSIKILLFTNSLILVSWAMLWPIYALFVKDIWWDLMDASFAWWLFALTAWITSLVAWRYTDKLKNKSLILILGYIIMWIWFFMYLIVDSIYILFLVQIIIWLWEAIYSPSFDALYSKNINKKQWWFEWWLWESMNYFTIAFWAFTWGLIVNNYWFNSIFIIMWTLSISSWIYIFFLPKKTFK